MMALGSIGEQVTVPGASASVFVGIHKPLINPSTASYFGNHLHYGNRIPKTEVDNRLRGYCCDRPDRVVLGSTEEIMEL